jgi:hypothetical protein
LKNKIKNKCKCGLLKKHLNISEKNSKTSDFLLKILRNFSVLNLLAKYKKTFESTLPD